MLDNVETVFDDMDAMLKKLKKKTYEERMKKFREEHGHYFLEMTQYSQGNNQNDAEVVANIFVDKIKERFQVKGKINGRKQADMNFFMIYYVFPAILLTNEENADDVASAVCEKWGAVFKNSKIGYTTYEKLYDSFRHKIFGIF